MSEDLIIKHCSPTLAGIKTANLFNCPYSSRLECECDVRKLNKMFCKKGIKVLPLKFSNGKALIYIFARPSLLLICPMNMRASCLSRRGIIHTMPHAV